MWSEEPAEVKQSTNFVISCLESGGSRRFEKERVNSRSGIETWIFFLAVVTDLWIAG